jgi:RNA polymerase sigma factor (sigma-70 family)
MGTIIENQVESRTVLSPISRFEQAYGLSILFVKKEDNMNLNSLDNIPIAALELSIKHYNSLMRAGCNTAGRLREAIEDESIWGIYGLGETSIREITEYLQKYIAEMNLSDIDNLRPQIERKESSAMPVTNDEANMGEIKDLQLISNQTQEGSLCPELLLGDRKPGDFLPAQSRNQEGKPEYTRSQKPLFLSENLDQELGFIFSTLSAREETIYLKYHLENVTLETIGQEQGVTRERIRQIITNARSKILIKLSAIRLDYVNYALALGKDLGGRLSRILWMSELVNHHLVDKEESSKTCDRLFAILTDKNIPEETFQIPANVELILKKTTNLPVYVVNALHQISKERFRDVERRVKFTGGIHTDQALEILECKPGELKGILDYRGLGEIDDGWYSIRDISEENSRLPLLQAGLKMWLYCGPLEFDVFYEGLERYVSRHYEALSPARIVSYYLKKLGFQINESRVSYEGGDSARISGSEEVALKIIDELGPVISFQEMVNGFLAAGYSTASATSKVMGGSPIVERVGTGFYKKRGVLISNEDLDKAIARQDVAEREPTISITADGKVRYQTTVTSWALGGVLSVGKLGDYLPDLSNGCPVYVGDKKYGSLSESENFIWGLTAAFKALNITFGDYIELEFDKRKQLKASVSVLQRKM